MVQTWCHSRRCVNKIRCHLYSSADIRLYLNFVYTQAFEQHMYLVNMYPRKHMLKKYNYVDMIEVIPPCVHQSTQPYWSAKVVTWCASAPET